MQPKYFSEFKEERKGGFIIRQMCPKCNVQTANANSRYLDVSNFHESADESGENSRNSRSMLGRRKS